MPSYTNPDKCIGCGSCETVCPTEAIHMEGAFAAVKQDLCIDCGACVPSCPARARSIIIGLLAP
jgi:NAD-dependent dihydropyrimidine dehydrogenase PreA subunit